MKHENRLANLNDEQLNIVHLTSEAFEKSLRSGQSVQIEKYLDSVPDELRLPTFCELLAMKIEWKRATSALPAIADYVARFPMFESEIRDVFGAELDSETQDSLGSGSSGEAPRHSAPNLRLPEGTVIDQRYTLLEVIGEGGMGTVYLAEQHHPVVRQVAIKFVKGGLDSKSVLARFDVERRALALMDHPGIARVYDGGQTDSGAPYFVMELVRGIPVTKYCDQQRLDISSRLALFVAICQAVQHAHFKGIVHRDLKPGNLLVVEIDGRPAVKVIDFGMAKATQPDGEQSDGNTLAIAGTPNYMSPEQASSGLQDIDSRTDVYSLGVILYELLTGMTPHAFDSSPGSSVWDVLRLIRESDAPRPSSNLKSSGALADVAARRNVEPQRLVASLQNELDWIVLKALEKDRARRYETVSSLASDVERFLAGEIVEARPPSQLYRMGKFVRRHRGMVIAAGLLTLTLVAGILGTGWGMFEARKNAESARQETLEKEQARLSEQTERQYADAIAKFVETDFLQLTYFQGRLEDEYQSGLTRDSTLSDLLDRAHKKLDTQTDLDPRIEARLRWIIGTSYRRLGNYSTAITSLERSVKLNEQVFGADHLQSLLATDGLAEALQLNGEYERAESLLTNNIDRKRRLFGEEDEQTLRSLEFLATNHRLSSQPTEAIAILEKTLAVRRKLWGVNEREKLVTMYALAQSLNQADRSEAAIALLEEILELQIRYIDDDHPDVHATRAMLGHLYNRSGQYDKALPLLKESLDWDSANYGPESPEAIFGMARLAGLNVSLGKLDGALELAQQTLELTRKVFGPDHPNMANAQSDLGRILFAKDDFAQARELFQAAVAARTSHVGEKHPSTLRDKINLASCLRSLGQAEEAFLLSEQNLQLATELLGENHSQTVAIKQGLAVGYWQDKQLERSIPLFQEILLYWETRSGRNHPQTLTAMANLGVNLRDAGRWDEAIPLLEEVYKAVPENPSLEWTGVALLDACLGGEKSERASALQQEILSGARAKLAGDPVKLSATLASVGQVMLKHQDFSAAEALLFEAATIRQTQSPEVWSTYDTLAMLGETYLKQQRHEEAEATLLAATAGMAKLASSASPLQVKRRQAVIQQLIEAARALEHSEIVSQWEAELAKF